MGATATRYGAGGVSAKRRPWRSMAAGSVLAQPNVVSKLSAFGTFIHRNDPDHIASMVRDTVRIFGAERCLFGSNFPIEKIWTDYASLIDAFKAATKGMSAARRRHIFRDTAERIYRL